MTKSITIVRNAQNHPKCIWNVLTNTMHNVIFYPEYKLRKGMV